jgi:hypothetical protein
MNLDAAIITKRPCLLTLPAVEYWETLSTVSVRRLWPMRSAGTARSSLRGWIGTLRQAKTVRAYRGWSAQ